MKSKSVLISMAVIVALSLGLVPLANLASGSFSTSSGGVALVGYYDPPDYHFLTYSYNGYGQPVQGTPVNLTITGASGRNSMSVATNSSGYAVVSMSGDTPGPSVYYSFASGS